MHPVSASTVTVPDAWIVADVGGTHARFTTWAKTVGLSSVRKAKYRNDEFADLPALVQRYRGDIGHVVPQLALAIAAPLGAGTLRMTNRAWDFAPEELRRSLRLDRLCLVNDFVAAAAGIGTLAGTDLDQIGGSGADGGPALILGPGTGLGAAALMRNGQSTRIVASEAGHMGAAPSQADARAVVERVRLRLGRASWERLLSGGGLASFDAVARGAENNDEPAAVANRALAGDAAARRAAGAFAYALGEFAGDLCLALRATGGVYLVGGVLNGLGAAFDSNALRAGFENKGRMSGLLQTVPCYRVHAEDVALRGLAQMLQGAVQAPILETRLDHDGTEEPES